MVNEIIREINYCLDNGCCIAALSLALTLPDICGKAMFANDKNNKKRYTKWIDKYALEEIKHNEHIYGFSIPDINGDIIYSLRCALLHEGNPHVGTDYFDYFELLYQEKQGGSRSFFTSLKEGYYNEENELKICKKSFSINVRELCFKICKVVENYYNKNKEKFNFFNYNLVDTDFIARNTFKVPKKDIIER